MLDLPLDDAVLRRVAEDDRVVERDGRAVPGRRDLARGDVDVKILRSASLLARLKKGLGGRAAQSANILPPSTSWSDAHSGAIPSTKGFRSPSTTHSARSSSEPPSESGFLST